MAKYDWIWIIVLVGLVIVMRPTIYPLEAMYTGEGFIKEGKANSVTTEYIVILQDEKVGQALVTVKPLTDIGTYELDVGIVGTDFTAEASDGEQTFDITKNLNDYREYCSVEKCNYPISIKISNSGNYTIASNITTEEITREPAYVAVEKSRYKPQVGISLALIVVAVLLAIFLLVKFLKPKWLEKI